MDSVSVVIPTKNAGPDFQGILQRIRGQDISDIEIVVIDSGSTDGTVDTAKELADKTVEIPQEKFHHGQTRNQAAKQTEGDIIVFTVQDATPINEMWLPELVEPILTGTADVTYGNQVAYPDAKPPDKFFYEYFYPETSSELKEEDTSDKSGFYLDNIFISDVSSAISRDVWQEFQFRDSVAMSEDKDFAYRVASAGYTIKYCPEAKVYHSHDYTLRSLFIRRYKDGKAFAEITSASTDDFAFSGLNYTCHEYSYLIRSGAFHWLPYALVYDSIHFLSFTLGKYRQQFDDSLD